MPRCGEDVNTYHGLQRIDVFCSNTLGTPLGQTCLAMVTANPVAAAIALTRFLLEELDAIALSTARLLDALEDGVRQDQMGFQAVVYWPWMTVEPPRVRGRRPRLPRSRGPPAPPPSAMAGLCARRAPRRMT